MNLRSNLHRYRPLLYAAALLASNGLAAFETYRAATNFRHETAALQMTLVLAQELEAETAQVDKATDLLNSGAQRLRACNRMIEQANP